MAKGWAGRVAIVPGSNGLAYVPGEVLVHVGRDQDASTDDKRAVVAGMLRKRPDRENDGRALGPADDAGYVKVTLDDTGDTLGTVRLLQGAGLLAQPNHVFFADAGPSSWSPVGADPVYGHPVYGHPVYGHPVYGHPVYGHPVYGHPVYGHPVYGHGEPGAGTPATGGPVDAEALCQACACADHDRCQCERPQGAASLVYPNPIYARAVYSDSHGLRYETTGLRPSNALPLFPTTPPTLANCAWDTPHSVRVAVIDTGWPLPDDKLGSYKNLKFKANANDPDGGTGTTATIPNAADEPDTEQDECLDPVAGHGMFIAGLIHQYAPAAAVKVARGLSTYGDGDEYKICALIDDLLANPDTQPHVLNLSFGTYAPEVPARLAESIQKAIAAGVIVVASAGNDGTSRPQYPAAYPGVVSVAALGPNGPAAFSNWGHWVRACAPGVDVASAFWTFDGKTARTGGADRDLYEGWALWSGTSFAAPIVAAALARELEPMARGEVPPPPSPAPGAPPLSVEAEEKRKKDEADRLKHNGDLRHTYARHVLARVIDHPRLHRMHCFGTVVNPPPSIGQL